jgi:molybdate transport system substrate-binding protein
VLKNKLLPILLLGLCGTATADEIRVAAASNFREAMTTLAQKFEQKSGHQVLPIFGSTGKQYAQIIHGAPFDAFFAADSLRPIQLEKDGLAVSGSRFTYAGGQLVLWQRMPGPDPVDRATLAKDGFRYLAMANPDLAPYGQAAAEVISSLDLWPQLENRVVRGENIGQTFQFVVSGNAELGLVAWSQLKSFGGVKDNDYWLVSADLYRPIEQQAVLLTESPAARDFMLYMQSDEAITVIRKFGYLTP